MDDWAAEALDGLADKTVRSHVDLLRPVTMLIGQVPLRDLTAQDVRRTLNKLAQTRSTRTMASTHNVLVRAIRHAEANDRVGRNVASFVKPPQGKTGRPSRAMTAAEAAGLLVAARDHPRLGAYVILSLTTGIRTEEARALRWDHVDLDGDPYARTPVPPHIAVWRSVRLHGDTKTEKSRRALPQKVLGWTAPKIRSPEAADRWTWLIIACYAQLRLARPLAADLRLPWQRPCPPGRLTPARSAGTSGTSARQQAVRPARRYPASPAPAARQGRRTADPPPAMTWAKRPEETSRSEPGANGRVKRQAEIRQRNLADADHLAVLHAIWTAETKDARDDRYRHLVLAALPPGYRQSLSHQARWLSRTLRAAELADLDSAEVINTAIASRDLAGARDIAAVLDARIRHRTDSLLPQPQGPWTARVPRLPDPGRRAYLTEIAALMDDRTHRLGQHTASTAPVWATSALGPVPADPAGRRAWERKASPSAAYREMYSYDHPGDPIGPEPGHQAPDQRAAWHQALAALGPAGGPDVRAMPDARLWLLRDTYAVQTAWAPRYAGKERRLARLGAAGADLGTIRAAAEADTARKADDHARAQRHETLAASYQALRDLYRLREQTFTQTVADRQEWEQATARSRQLAIAADAELRCRYPDQQIEPLHSAEPAPVSDTERQHLDVIPHQRHDETVRIRDPGGQRQAFAPR